MLKTGSLWWKQVLTVRIWTQGNPVFIYGFTVKTLDQHKSPRKKKLLSSKLFSLQCTMVKKLPEGPKYLQRTFWSYLPSEDKTWTYTKYLPLDLKVRLYDSVLHHSTIRWCATFITWSFGLRLQWPTRKFPMVPSFLLEWHCNQISAGTIVLENCMLCK